MSPRALLPLLWLAPLLVATAQQQQEQEVSHGHKLPLGLGVGCVLSNYSLLPVVTAMRGEPSFRVAIVPGFGLGAYVVHFDAFQLPETDVLVIREVDGASTSIVLGGGNATGSFYSTAIAGRGVTLELFRASATPPPPTQTARGVACYGFQVDELLFVPQERAEAALTGRHAVEMVLTPPNTSTGFNPNADESLCGEDESVAAACVEDTAMVNASAAVARLTISKDNNMDAAYCTGFLLGCEGHVLTNQHCIGSWIDALNTHVEFHARGASCDDSCDSRAACRGSVVVSTTSLVAESEELDYALVRLTPPNGSQDVALLSAVGTYLQLRGTAPALHEEVYIPQHPLGYGMRLSWTNNGKPGRIESVTVDTCRQNDLGYYVDTQEGSSGSPVIAVADNTVIGLHHCGGCLNSAIPSTALIDDMRAKGVLPACAVAGESKVVRLNDGSEKKQVKDIKAANETKADAKMKAKATEVPKATAAKGSKMKATEVPKAKATNAPTAKATNAPTAKAKTTPKGNATTPA